VTVNDGKGNWNVKNVKTSPQTKVKDFLNSFVNKKVDVEKVKPKNIELHHAGVKLSEDSTF
jgi:hypothetical protein